MFKRLQRKLTPSTSDATPPAWQTVIAEQQAQVATAPKQGLITPPPPPMAPTPGKPTTRAPIASQGDLLAWNKDAAGAERAYLVEARKSPLDPIPLMQILRLKQDANAAQIDIDQLRQKIASRVPDDAQRVLAWFSLYRPRAQQGSRWTCTDLQTLMQQSQVANIDTLSLKQVLGAPSGQGGSWLQYAASQQKAADVHALLALCRDADTWAPQSLVDALQASLEQEDVATCAALVNDTRVDVEAMGADNVERLLQLAAQVTDGTLQSALAARGLHSVGALANAIAHHRFARVVEQLKHVSWSDKALGPVVALACKREHERVAIVRQLIAAGMPLDAGDDQGNTPLMAAVQGGAADVVRLLLQAGANRDTRHPNTQLTAAQFAEANGVKACARELHYPDALAETCAFVHAKVANLDATSKVQITALLETIESADLEASAQLLQTLLPSQPGIASEIKRTVRHVVAFPEYFVSQKGTTALRWVNYFVQPEAQLMVFDLFYLTPSSWWPLISKALHVYATNQAGVVGTDKGNSDAWLKANAQTVEAIFKTCAGAGQPQRASAWDERQKPWPWDYLLEMTQRFPSMTDAQRARILQLATECDARGYEPETLMPPELAIASLSRHAKSVFSRMFNIEPIRISFATPVEEKEPEVLVPRAPNTPFPYHTSQRRERYLDTSLAQFIQTSRPPLIEAASEAVCSEAERLLKDTDTLDEMSDSRVALAYLQLLQSIVGVQVLAEVFKGEQASANTMPIKRLQLKAHPDKNGTPGLASCLNALSALLGNKTDHQELAAQLRAAYEATAETRAAFYEGNSVR